MADQETTTKEQPTPPTVAELEGKVQRLKTQTNDDTRAIEAATKALAAAGKSGSIEAMVEASSARETAVKSAGKTISQLKTATGAVASTKRAANAGKIADIHTQMAQDRNINTFMEALEALECKWIKIERSEETGKLTIQSPETTPKRASGGGGNSRGQSVTVGGKEFASANAALKEHFPDSGPLSRKSILSKLVNAGHKVS